MFDPSSFRIPARGGGCSGSTTAVGLEETIGGDPRI
jgi:hypothetical protein